MKDNQVLRISYSSSVAVLLQTPAQSGRWAGAGWCYGAGCSGGSGLRPPGRCLPQLPVWATLGCTPDCPGKHRINVNHSLGLSDLGCNIYSFYLQRTLVKFSVTINISTIHLKEDLKWHLVWRRQEFTSQCLSFGPIKRPNHLCITCYVHMQRSTLCAFPHLSEHRTSFQAFCRWS